MRISDWSSDVCSSDLFDTWAYATRDWSPLRRWLSRSKMMLIVSRNFMVDRSAGISELLRQDGQRNLRNWGRLFWYLMIYPVMMRRNTWTRSKERRVGNASVRTCRSVGSQ